MAALLSEVMLARSRIGSSLIALVLACNSDSDGAGSDASSDATADGQNSHGETATDTVGDVTECPYVNYQTFSGNDEWVWTSHLTTQKDVIWKRPLLSDTGATRTSPIS